MHIISRSNGSGSFARQSLARQSFARQPLGRKLFARQLITEKGWFEIMFVIVGQIIVGQMIVGQVTVGQMTVGQVNGSRSVGWIILHVGMFELTGGYYQISFSYHRLSSIKTECKRLFMRASYSLYEVITILVSKQGYPRVEKQQQCGIEGEFLY